MAEKEHSSTHRANTTHQVISRRAVIAILGGVTAVMAAIVTWLDFVQHILQSGYQIFIWAGLLVFVVIWLIILWLLFKERMNVGVGAKSGEIAQ